MVKTKLPPRTKSLKPNTRVSGTVNEALIRQEAAAPQPTKTRREKVDNASSHENVISKKEYQKVSRAELNRGLKDAAKAEQPTKGAAAELVNRKAIQALRQIEPLSYQQFIALQQRVALAGGGSPAVRKRGRPRTAAPLHKQGRVPMTQGLLERVARRFLAVRMAYDQNQTEVAKRMGVTNKVISNVETGRNFPDERLLIVFCLMTGCPTDFILLGKLDHVPRTMAVLIGIDFPDLISPDAEETIEAVSY